LRRLIVTMGGVGYLPASGTFASLLTCLLLWPAWAAAPDPFSQNLICLIGLLFFSVLCVALGRWAVEFFGREDPGQLVLDEAAGICLAAIGLPTGHWSIPLRLIAIFISFRIFDITKPFPLRRLEELPYGWGILLDDLGAAIYANLLCQLVLRWLAR
jgi:phosphatidylglycerophosphatase A